MNLKLILNIFLFISLSVAETTTDDKDNPQKCAYYKSKYAASCEENANGEVISLNISGKQLTEFPQEILSLTNLEKLYLRNNLLTSLPEEIGSLSNLKTLDLYDNLLTSLPKAIGSLSNLKTLGLSNNLLTSLPEAIGSLSNLKELYLRNNLLTSLPEGLKNIFFDILGVDNNCLISFDKNDYQAFNRGNPVPRKCSTHCSSPIDNPNYENECKECDPGYELTNGVCISKCTDGFAVGTENIGNFGKIVTCTPVHCKGGKISDTNECNNGCEIGYVMPVKNTESFSTLNKRKEENADTLTGSCSICDDGYEKDKNGNCIPVNCEKNTDNNKCEKCISGYVLDDNGLCNSKCVEGYTESKENENKRLTCTPVHCLDENIKNNKCVGCEIGYAMPLIHDPTIREEDDNTDTPTGSCSICDDGYEKDKNGNCIPANCEKKTDNNKCEKCILGYELDERDTCISVKCGKGNNGIKCPEGFCCTGDGKCVENTDEKCNVNKGCQQDYGTCKCGKDEGKCRPGMCCSKDGHCGTTVKFCSNSNGCQLSYGDCRCGIIDGKEFGKCNPGECCSKNNYCGTSPTYCSEKKGCQKSYGDCRCGIVDGEEFGNCKAGECCSKKNYCGTSPAYCSEKKGCQKSYGDCRCGIVDGEEFGKCNPGECCSKWNYCGKSPYHCSASNGCTTKYGDCKCGKKGEKDYGKCPKGECCSKNHYCGITSAYCGIGCISEFGTCFK